MKKLSVLFVVLILIIGFTVYYLSTSKPKPAPTVEPKPTPPPSAFIADPTEAAVTKAADYLKKSQNEDGGWSVPGMPKSDPGITALVLKSLAKNGIKLNGNPWMQKAVDLLLSYQKDDGSIFLQSMQSYVTAISIVALVELDPVKYAPQIAKAKDYLIRIQFRPGEERTKEPHYVGGITYNDEQKPPNMSTTIFALEALRAAGVPEDSEVFKNAALFVSRCQNRSESNDMPLDVILTNDGGFFYAPGDSRGEIIPGEQGRTLRSYGSMTYAGFLGFIYCYISKDDPRAKSALEWIQNNYTFEQNPGLPKKMQGYYYYLLTIAKALDAGNLKTLPDGKPVVADLKAKILEKQKADGTWINDQEDRWQEGNPILTTAYMLTALGHIKAVEKR